MRTDTETESQHKMSDINQVILTGNLTADPDAKWVGQECERVFFGLACNKKTSRGETTAFVDCKAWKPQAAFIAQYCKKGAKIALVGELTLDRWTDEQGNNRQKLRVTVKQVQILDKPPDTAPGHHAHYQEPSINRQGCYDEPSYQQFVDPNDPAPF